MKSTVSHSKPLHGYTKAVKHCGDLNWDEETKWAAEARQEESFLPALIICEATAETSAQFMSEELLKYS